MATATATDNLQALKQLCATNKTPLRRMVKLLQEINEEATGTDPWGICTCPGREPFPSRRSECDTGVCSWRAKPDTDGRVLELDQLCQHNSDAVNEVVKLLRLIK